MTSAEPGITPLIVVGVDGSTSSDDALRWALAQAVRTGARVEAIAAWRWPGTWGTALPLPEGYDPATDAQTMLDGVVGRVAGEYPGVAIERRLEEGPAAHVLVDRSAEASLLVVGSRGHGEFSGMLLGSVSQHCAANAHCPVLVHRTPDSN